MTPYHMSQVFASTASIPGSNSSSSGRTHTRLVIGDSWLFAALFESHYGSDLMHPSEAAARFCAQRCYTEFQLAANAAGPATEGSDGKDMRSILTATIKALDRRFLADDDTSQQVCLLRKHTGLHAHLQNNCFVSLFYKTCAVRTALSSPINLYCVTHECELAR